MNIREKYLSLHPFPPQDIDAECKMSQSASLESIGSTFRRRQPPEYDIFKHSLPPATTKYRYEFIDGLMRIFHNDDDETNEQVNNKRENMVDSVFPVYSFEEFVKDYNFVSVIFGVS